MTRPAKPTHLHVLEGTLNATRHKHRKHEPKPHGVLFILGGLLWFLPVVGIEMLPVGLLLIAQDVPFLRRPVGRFMIWLERKWVALRRRWKHA